MANNLGPYVRVLKKWSRNSGFAQYSWLYYVDLVNAEGDISCVNAHGCGMGKYGMLQAAAQIMAETHSMFFGWPIRHFEEQQQTTVIMKEVKRE